MGKVGGLRPPQEFARALRDFDPDLRAEWNYQNQCWWIVQLVRRHRAEGSFAGGTLASYRDMEVPVMQLTSFPGALDSRALVALREQRAVTLKEYELLARKRLRDQRTQSKAKARTHIDAATEDALDLWYDPTIRKRAGLPARVKGWRPDGNEKRISDQDQPAA